MSGRIESDDLGQLAIMDAVVFFAGAILISSSILSFSNIQPAIEEQSDASLEASYLLDCVLSASIGSNLSVDAGHPMHLSRQTLVRDCIAFEGDCLFRGVEASGFSDLNLIVMRMLKECAPPSVDPCLLIVYKSYSEPLLALPHIPDDVRERIASSVTLTLEGGSEIMVVLVLCPPAPSELDEI